MSLLCELLEGLFLFFYLLDYQSVLAGLVDLEVTLDESPGRADNVLGPVELCVR